MQFTDEIYNPTSIKDKIDLLKINSKELTKSLTDKVRLTIAFEISLKTFAEAVILRQDEEISKDSRNVINFMGNKLFLEKCIEESLKYEEAELLPDYELRDSIIIKVAKQFSKQ